MTPGLRCSGAGPLRLMPRSESTFSLLADIATIRGRLTEAAHLRGGADWQRTNDPDRLQVVRDALAEVQAVGDERAVANALREVPRDVRLLIEHELVDIPTAARLASAGIVTLRRSPGSHRATPRAGAAIRGRRGTRCTAWLARGTETPVPLGRAWDILDDLLAVIRETGPEVERAEVVGSTRRFATFSAISSSSSRHPIRTATAARLAALGPPQSARPCHGRTSHPRRRSIRDRHSRRDAGRVRGGAVPPHRIADTRVGDQGACGHIAGSASTGCHANAASRPAFAQEADIYAALDLPYIAPELREGDGEIDAALAGTLPVLLTVGDMRGDLHMHTDWSDGRDSIDVMVDAAEALGYEYVAVTDHSKSSAIARGLDADRLAQQRDAIAAARERHPRITILHGAEVDILRDGSLDFPDTVLESLDVVLASLHDPGTDSGSELTDRYVAAMRHPLVQIVTHPTNRLVPGRAGYDLDEDRFFAAAVETGTIVEIDGAPGHLDMDGAMARRAIAAGVDVSVDGDCHRAERLGHQMAFGVATARRGWVTASDVVNTRPLAALKATLARKRTGS